MARRTYFTNPNNININSLTAVRGDTEALAFLESLGPKVNDRAAADLGNAAIVTDPELQSYLQFLAPNRGTQPMSRNAGVTMMCVGTLLFCIVSLFIMGYLQNSTRYLDSGISDAKVQIITSVNARFDAISKQVGDSANDVANAVVGHVNDKLDSTVQRINDVADALNQKMAAMDQRQAAMEQRQSEQFAAFQTKVGEQINTALAGVAKKSDVATLKKAMADNTGALAAKIESLPGDSDTLFLSEIFQPGKDIFTNAGKKSLEDLATQLKSGNKKIASIRGYAGTDSKLGSARAVAIKVLLEGLGVEVPSLVENGKDFYGTRSAIIKTAAKSPEPMPVAKAPAPTPAETGSPARFTVQEVTVSNMTVQSLNVPAPAPGSPSTASPSTKYWLKH